MIATDHPIGYWVSPQRYTLTSLSQASQAFHAKMSVTKPKIVVRTAASATMPKASTITVAVPKASAARTVVVAAKAPAKKTVQKVVYVEEEEEEEVLSPAQIIAGLEQQLASLRTALKVKGLKKDGTPRAKREYVASEAQSAWNNYVQEVREEHGYLEDEEGNYIADPKTGLAKLALSYKDAMTIASVRRRSGDPSAPPAAAAAPKKAVAATVVALPKKTLAMSTAAAGMVVVTKPSAAASKVVATKPSAVAAPRKTAAELKAEFLAKKAAAAAEEEDAPVEEAAPAEAEEESSEAVEWEFEGQTYFKTGDNLCWLQTEGGDRIWAGVFLPGEKRIDDSVAEPQFDE